MDRRADPQKQSDVTGAGGREATPDHFQHPSGVIGFRPSAPTSTNTRNSTTMQLEVLLSTIDPLSVNHDTGFSLDWPHYCSFATEACGGERGWCYTFAGFHVSKSQAQKVALNDVMARRLPLQFAQRVVTCVQAHVSSGRLPYPNLRFSGSGEITLHHIDALEAIDELGVQLWGFTKNPIVAERLSTIGVAVIFSSDRTSDPSHVERARNYGVKLAYSSVGVDDRPPGEIFVTFPVHVSGRVTEVVDHPSVCPKVVEEFLHGTRTPGWCQERCQRCHLNGEPALASDAGGRTL